MARSVTVEMSLRLHSSPASNVLEPPCPSPSHSLVRCSSYQFCVPIFKGRVGFVSGFGKIRRRRPSFRDHVGVKLVRTAQICFPVKICRFDSACRSPLSLALGSKTSAISRAFDGSRQIVFDISKSIVFIFFSDPVKFSSASGELHKPPLIECEFSVVGGKKYQQVSMNPNIWILIFLYYTTK